MLQRFFELREHLDHEDDTILEILPTLGETKKLKCLLEDLKKVESVSKRVQSTDATMWEVRTLFDALVIDFPSFEHYIGGSANIVGNPNFENAVTKLQRGRTLTRPEKLAVAALRSNNGADDASDEDAGFAERALKRARLADENDTYVLLGAVTPTSNIAERLFSMARALIGLDRFSLHPIMIEATLFLKCNRSYWDVSTVHETLE
ncbi:hypothetical protein AaE_015540 [Aphanomyces astaci]|uniref:HAT C-terminal dimerisation domain-containing protein n=1 Tax=Aphanomyces astaci TaxID=112090 RepID=A0A6A4YZZ8_APHAT|nr:hypothetical protein AaE_015540 [Aphanomyces astaci]